MGNPSPQQNGRAYPQQMFSRNAYGGMGAPTSNGAFRSDSYGKNDPQMYGMSMMGERHGSVDRLGSGIIPTLATSTSDPAVLGRRTASILIRRLSRGISSEALGAMLVFAGDLIGTDFVRSPFPEDGPFATAIARFQSEAGAFEAQQKLHGKPNTSKDANMVVEMQGSNSGGPFERRNTIDGMTSRTQNSSTSSTGSLSGPPTGRSRFGSTFQSGDKVSPPLPTPGSGTSSEFPLPDSSAHLQKLFSPQSPLTNGVHEHHVSGKLTINDDSADDETGELIRDPVAFARNGQQPFTRRTSNTQTLSSRFGSLSLSTGNGNGSSNGLTSPQTAGMTSPRNTSSMQSPISSMSPTSFGGVASNASFAASNPRPQYPPVNPADQNPPCNTLYVGNLPIDTSEDELKQIFQRQRGYRRLCFRTKQNGPMCFVEFEDVGFATRALHELYGHPLHNSVKGGIRLSFSKNPLGVRSHQAGPLTNGSMQNLPPGLGGAGNGQGFSSVSGPPPGLGSPPGLMSEHGNGIGNGYRPAPPVAMDSMFSNPFGMPSHDFVDQLGPRTMSGGVPAQMGDATFTRDGRPAYTEFMMGH